MFDSDAFDERLAEADAPLALFRETLKEIHAEMLARFRAGIPAHELVHQRAAAIDGLLVRAWELAELDQREGLALVAVGGYGRGELHPGSDIDLLILLRDAADGATRKRIQGFVAFLWDLGLEVGHSVRTLSECVSEARKDITIATNLMEARLVEGPRALFRELRKRTGRSYIWPSRRFFEAKWQEQVSRHHRFNDTAYNLEPHVKEGPGGLRDIQVVGWVAKRHFGADTLHELVTHGFLTEPEFQALVEGQNFLWQVRFALHALAGRREDRLLFDAQRVIAQDFGYRDTEHSLAVEKFMKEYYRTIMELARLNEMLLELFQEVILHADAPEEIEPINRRFQARNGFLEVVDERVFRRHPFALLEMFLVMQQHPELKGVRATTIRQVRAHRHLLDDKFRSDIRARSLFLEILRQPRGITHELRRMHRYGILARYIPSFEAVVGQMQHDLFHVYTVDEHSLMVVRNLRAFTVPERFHEFPLCSAIFQRLPKPEILYLAGFFHDIGKGCGGDHSEIGAQLGLEFCLHHGMSAYDARLVAWLVRNHLVMSMTAQRQDIEDPEIVNAFAARMGDRIHLDYLYLLTVADIRATNPNLWNDWKDSLLRDLYESTHRVLRRGLANPVDRTELITETRQNARRALRAERPRNRRIERLWKRLGEEYFLRGSPEEIAWHTRGILRTKRSELPLVLVRSGRRGTEIFVYMHDRDFIFAAITSVLDRLGLTILDARIITADNRMTLDSFIVLEENGTPSADADREREIRERLREQLKHPEDITAPARRLPRRQLRHFPIATRVAFYLDPARNRTIMEVIAGDRPGLLARIAWVMAKEGIRLQNAKIATYGERAEDVFFIADAANGPLADATAERLRSRITATLDDGPRAGRP